MKTELGFLKRKEPFTYMGKEYKAVGIDPNKSVNSILCMDKDDSRIWLDVATPVEVFPMSDQDAADLLYRNRSVFMHDREMLLAIDTAVAALKGTKAKWKAKDFHTCYCDNCNFEFDIMKCEFMENMKHCPNCGADMQGDS